MDISTQLLQSINQALRAEKPNLGKTTVMPFVNPTPEQQRLIEEIGENLSSLAGYSKSFASEIKNIDKVDVSQQQSWQRIETFISNLKDVFAQQPEVSETHETQKQRTR